MFAAGRPSRGDGEWKLPKASRSDATSRVQATSEGVAPQDARSRTIASSNSRSCRAFSETASSESGAKGYRPMGPTSRGRQLLPRADPQGTYRAFPRGTLRPMEHVKPPRRMRQASRPPRHPSGGLGSAARAPECARRQHSKSSPTRFAQAALSSRACVPTQSSPRTHGRSSSRGSRASSAPPLHQSLLAPHCRSPRHGGLALLRTPCRCYDRSSVRSERGNPIKDAVRRIRIRRGALVYARCSSSGMTRFTLWNTFRRCK